jgi:Ecdysteroid kinase-like family
MNDRVITNIDQITPAWLAASLFQSGALTHGTVETFELGTGQGNWSSSATLLLKYSEDSRGSLPGRLFLKMVETDLGDGESFSDSEVTYYMRDYTDLAAAPILRCYDARYSPELRRYHILLEDVSETHIAAAEKEPTLAYGLALGEALATLHARWWGADRLAVAGTAMHSPVHIQRFVDISEPGAQHILRDFSHELQPHWPELLREIYARHPNAMLERTRDPNGFTIIHGDVGCGNVLVPRQGDRPLYIIDRQPFNWSLTVWLGVYDLAYAIVLDWDVELRRQHEFSILKLYHEQLIKHGVREYSWEQLILDYKLCVMMGAYVATEYCRGGVNERWTHVWLPMLQRALTACDDLECQPGGPGLK